MSAPTRPPAPTPDPFLIELAELAGLDPAQVIDRTLDVTIEREDGKTVAMVTAQVAVMVDPDEVTRLAMKYDRIRPTRSA